EPLSEAGVVVGLFTEGEPEPSLRAADRCIAMAREFKPDGILGLGGGSNMDLAKITAVVFRHGGNSGSYECDDKTRGPARPRAVSCPTASPAATEAVTRWPPCSRKKRSA